MDTTITIHHNFGRARHDRRHQLQNPSFVKTQFKQIPLVHPQRRYLGGNHNFNLGHLEIDFQYGIRPIRSYVRTIHLQNPHQSTFVTMTTLKTKKSWDNYNMTIAKSYLIFFFFSTRAKFLENKIYTEKRQFLRQICKKRHFFA